MGGSRSTPTSSNAQTIIRKNALFAGSDGGGRAWATIATLLTTAKMNGVDPNIWLTQTLQRIAGCWPNSQIADLMPWNSASNSLSYALTEDQAV